MPITVCHPVWRLDRGGLETQLIRLLHHAPSPAMRHVLVVRGMSPIDPGALGLPGHVRVVVEPGMSADPMFSRRLALILRNERVNLLHIRGLSMLVDGLAAAELCAGVAISFSFHGFESVRVAWSSMRRKVYRQAALRCDDRWAVSRAAASAIADELCLSHDLFDVLHNGVDVEHFRPAADQGEVRRRLGLPVDKRVILCVGSLQPVKGQDLLIHAMPSLGPRIGETVLVFVGADRTDGRLAREARSGCAGSDIRFVGVQDEVLPWYQAADIYVQPSRSEACCNALLEAMACGLPVIATRLGGNAELIDHDHTGLLASRESPESLAGHLNTLLSDSRLCKGLGAAARSHVQLRHDHSVALSSLINRYLSLATRANGDQSAQELRPATGTHTG